MQAEKHSCTACIDKAQPFRYTEGRIESRGIFHVLSEMRSAERHLRPFLLYLRRSDARTCVRPLRTQPVPVIVQQVRPGARAAYCLPIRRLYPCPDGLRPVAVLPVCRHCLNAVAVLHLLDLLLGISGGIESVWAAIDASPSGLMQFLQAAFWLPELLTVIGVWSAAGACRSRGAQISTGGLNCLRTAAVFRIIFEALELTFLLIYLLFYSAEDFFSFHFAGEEYVVFVMAGGCALTIVLQGCIIAALNSANEAAVKARATTLPPMLLAVIVMAEAAMQIIGLAMYWVAPYLDYDIALQLYGMFGYLNGSVLLHMFSLLFSAVSGILFSVVTLRYRREVSAAMEAE